MGQNRQVYRCTDAPSWDRVHTDRHHIYTVQPIKLHKIDIKACKYVYNNHIIIIIKTNAIPNFRVVDYRRLNKETTFDAYPLPNINNILTNIPDCKFFSVLDAVMGYHQIKLIDSDADKSSIVTPTGLYKFRVLPMGLTNASQRFMRVMQKILKNTSPKICLCYLDDIIVFGDTFEQHLENLMTVLTLLYNNNIKIHAHGTKTKLFQTHVTFLGHAISKEGIQCTEDKIAAIKDYPSPTTPKECRKALGLFGYLRKFCQNYGIIAKPIFELTGKTNKDFIWTHEAEAAFKELKHLLTSPKTLAIPRPDDTLVLTTDACAKGIGAVLQVRRDGELKPVAFASQALKKTQTSYSATKLEAYAIVHFVQHFRYMLLSKKFQIQCDHRPLVWLHNFKEPPAIVARWLEILGEYNYEIVYKPGKLNQCADSLSRSFENMNNITDVTATETPISSTQIKEHQLKDKNIQVLIDILKNQRQPTASELSTEPGTIRWYYNKRDKLRLKNECLFFLNKTGTERLVVPKHIIPTILKLSHNALTAGHRSSQKIFDLLKPKYHWIKMREKIEEYVKCCTTCGQLKKDQHHLKAPLVPTVVQKKWERLQIDIVGPFHKSQRNKRYLLTAICAYSKFARAWPLSDVTSETIAKTLVNEHFSIFGLPQSIHSDNGANFCSDLMASLYQLLGLRHTKSHTYCAFNNSAVERWHLTLEQSITAQASNKPRSWDTYVPLCVLSYNCQPHSSTGFSPFRMMFGEEARLPLDLMFGPTPSDQQMCPHEYIQWLENALVEIYNQANKKTAGKIQYMKRHYDKKAYGQPHEVGDLVWILKGIYEHKKVPKLRKPFKGPYKIINKLSNISYEVENLTPPHEKCLVHFNRTKKCHLSEFALKKYLKSTEKGNEDNNEDDNEEDKDTTLEPKHDQLIKISEVLPPPPPLTLGRAEEIPNLQPQLLEQSEIRTTRSGQIYTLF